MDALTLARATGAQFDRAQLFAGPLATAMELFNINNPNRWACFLATVAIESDYLEEMEEGLSYSSADRLRLIFPSLFVESKGGKYRAEDYVHNPKGLSELRYQGFHGRGLIQLTWRDTYKAAGEALGFDYLAHPELVLEPEHAALTAAWFFSVHAHCLLDADHLDMFSITGKVNGPARLKLSERKSQMELALKALSVP